MKFEQTTAGRPAAEAAAHASGGASDHQCGVVRADDGGFVDELVEAIEERARLSNVADVEPQAVNLDDPGVGLDLVGTRRAEAVRGRTTTCRRRFGRRWAGRRSWAERVDDLDLADAWPKPCPEM